MSRPWMPLYVADYLADTGHLSGAEHGAYLLLIMHYWQRGSLPQDDRKLASIARATPEQWADMRPTIIEFFSEDWRHARVDAELDRTRKAYEKRANAGRAGGKAKAANQHSSSIATSMPEQSSTNHNHNHNKSYPASQHSSGGTAPIDIVSERLPEFYAALAITDETKTPGLLSLSEPIRWVEAGCDIDGDILPALRVFAAKGKAVRNWSYCSEAVFEARDRRLLPTPAPRAREGPPPGKRKNAIEAYLSLQAKRAQNDEQPGRTDDHRDVELLPPNDPRLRSVVGDAVAAMRWPDRSGDH